MISTILPICKQVCNIYICDYLRKSPPPHIFTAPSSSVISTSYIIQKGSTKYFFSHTHPGPTVSSILGFEGNTFCCHVHLPLPNIKTPASLTLCLLELLVIFQLYFKVIFTQIDMFCLNIALKYTQILPGNVPWVDFPGGGG